MTEVITPKTNFSTNLRDVLKQTPKPSITTQDLPAEDVETIIKYEIPKNEQLYFYAEPEPGKSISNSESEERTVLIKDIRREKSSGKYTIDKTGFQVVDDSKHDPDFSLFIDKDRIRKEYYPQVESILKEATGGKKVFIFDHTIRRNNNLPETRTNRQPVMAAHIDQTGSAVIQRVHRHLGEEAEELLKKRVQLINVWRPLIDNNTDFPLAVTDYNTIDEEKDLIVSHLIYKDYRGETYRVKYNPNHRWYYFSHQNKNDVFLLKCYDSDKSVARFTPHSAFFNPKSSKDAPARESIEVRALVFH